MSLRSLLHKIVLLRPLLKILGVKDKSTAAKIGDAASVIDDALGETAPTRDGERTK